ncbi:hypothetical protein RTS15_000382 [Salmonella enterica]|nr:hypothetical protein [Salmonella enterica]
MAKRVKIDDIWLVIGLTGQVYGQERILPVPGGMRETGLISTGKTWLYPALMPWLRRPQMPLMTPKS